MRIWFGRLAGLAMVLMLASCTTDALTPQAEVPNAEQKTSATQNQPADQSVDPSVATQPMETASQPTVTGPQNTLQAQAQALEEQGINPAASEPITVDARNKTIYNSPQVTTATEEANTQQVAAATQSGTIRFLPIIGAPVQSVTPLSRSLGTEARARGLTIKSSSDTTSDHILKGYLSAFNDGEKTTVVYVWDVLDNAGQRLNRLQGQETIPGAAKDAWSSVPPDVMTKIGVETINSYLAWKQGA